MIERVECAVGVPQRQIRDKLAIGHRALFAAVEITSVDVTGYRRHEEAAIERRIEHSPRRDRAALDEDRAQTLAPRRRRRRRGRIEIPRRKLGLEVRNRASGRDEREPDLKLDGRARREFEGHTLAPALFANPRRPGSRGKVDLVAAKTSAHLANAMQAAANGLIRRIELECRGRDLPVFETSKQVDDDRRRRAFGKRVSMMCCACCSRQLGANLTVFEHDLVAPRSGDFALFRESRPVALRGCLRWIKGRGRHDAQDAVVREACPVKMHVREALDHIVAGVVAGVVLKANGAEFATGVRPKLDETVRSRGADEGAPIREAKTAAANGRVHPLQRIVDGSERRLVIRVTVVTAA